MVADTKRSSMLMFEGETLSSRLFDLWVWDGTGWSARQPFPAPAARSHHALAYDEVRDRVVLFGGSDVFDADLGDTWEWDGQTRIPLSPVAAPTPRHGHTMAYDADRRRVVLTGGQTAAAEVLGDTWEWDGSAWLERAPGGAPPHVTHAALSYDPRARQLVLFAGRTSSSFSDRLRFYSTTQPARYLLFGALCAGTAGSPGLAALPHQWPWSGGPFTVDVTDVPAGAPVGFAFGVSNTTWAGASPFGVAVAVDVSRGDVGRVVDRSLSSMADSWSLPSRRS